jgi:hypothetical protein
VLFAERDGTEAAAQIKAFEGRRCVAGGAICVGKAMGAGCQRTRVSLRVTSIDDGDVEQLVKDGHPHRLEKNMQTSTVTRRLVLVALTLNFGVAGVYAQEKHVKMTFSGTNVATTLNLQANTVTDETQLAGRGSFGQFTFRELHADGAVPSFGCMGPFFGVLKGAGVFRFQDGSLLVVTVVDGSGCINPTAGNAALIVNYQISGGSGRFAGASGNLKMTGTLMCWLRNASNACTFLTNTGKFEGTLFGAAPEDEERDERQ